jgi:hypothetical protein
MSWRLLVVAIVPLAIGCSDSIAPVHPAAAANSAFRPRFIVDSSAVIHIVTSLGPNFTAQSFNRYDEIAGLTFQGTTPTIFREKNGGVQMYTPPAGYQVGTAFYPLTVGIDSLGDVAGSLESDTAYRAVVWTANGTGLGLLPTYKYQGMPVGPLGCGANGMSPHGYIAGTCETFTADDYIAEWPQITSGLDTLKTSCCGSIDGTAIAVSDDEYLTGYIVNFNPPQAFRWTYGSATYNIIGVVNGSPQISMGLAVNNLGAVAGWGIGGCCSDTAAQLWINPAQMTTIADYGQATGVDPSDRVVGWHRSTAGAQQTAFLWEPDSGLRDLPGLTVGGASAAVAINSVRHILGWALDAAGEYHTVIWDF